MFAIRHRAVQMATTWEDYRSGRLYDAAARGEVASVREMLDDEVNPDWCNLVDGLTPLHIAALKGRAECVLAWAASGAAGVGGHAGMAAAAAAAAVRRVGGASAVQTYGKLPGTGCDAPAAAVAQPAEAKPSRPNAMCAFGESYRSTRPGRSSLPFLAYPREQAHPRCILALRFRLPSPSLLSTRPPWLPPLVPHPDPSQPSQPCARCPPPQAHSSDLSFDSLKAAQRPAARSGQVYQHASQWPRTSP